jgi:hypothetical protein
MTTKLPRHSLLRRDLERLVAHGDWLPVGTIPHNVAVAELLSATGSSRRAARAATATRVPPTRGAMRFDS